MKDSDAQNQVWKNQTRTEELKERVGRLEKDLSKHREDFNEYKKNQQQKKWDNKLNKRLAATSILSAIIGAIAGYGLNIF